MSPDINWLIESARLTAFPCISVADARESSNWFNSTFAQAPSKQLSDTNLGFQQYEAERGGGKLVLVSRADRHDWQLIPKDPVPGASPDFPHVAGDVREIDFFFCSVEDFLLTAELPCSRIAVNINFVRPVATPVTAAEVFRSMLPNVYVPDNATDFIYQINLATPRNGTSPAMNRLAKWSEMQLMNFNVLNVGNQGKTTMHMNVIGHVCRLEIDVNTDPGEDISLEGDDLRRCAVEARQRLEQVASRGLACQA